MSNHDKALAKVNTTFDETVERILSVYDRATDSQLEEGMQWYPLNGAWVVETAHATGYSIDTVAAVAAHLSPRIDWNILVPRISLFLANGADKGLLKANVKLAKDAIVASDPLSTVKGKKTKAFAANLLGDLDAVTVDIWALRVALPGKVKGTEPSLAGVHAALCDAYREAASRRGITPPSMQAVTWVVIRGKA